MDPTTRWEKELADQVEIATRAVWRRAGTLLEERDEARRHACRLMWERDEARTECEEAKGPQLCGHPRSAIIYNVCKEGEDISHYCGECNAEAEAEVRRDDRLNTDPEIHNGFGRDPDQEEQMVRC